MVRIRPDDTPASDTPASVTPASVTPADDTLYDGGFPYAATVSPGPLVFTAGISPLDGDGAIVDGDLITQTRCALDTLMTVLARRGAGSGDVVKLTVYVVADRREQLAQVWEIVTQAFATPPPAMMMGVTLLPYPGQLVEVDAIAAPPGPDATADAAAVAVIG